MDIFNLLTVINSILIALLPLAFFRRQKLQEIKYKEIMELNVKTHDITKRADRSLASNKSMDENDFNRLDYLVSRFKKHSSLLSSEIQQYKEMWELAIQKSRNETFTEKELGETKKALLKKSEEIRRRADKLLN